MTKAYELAFDTERLVSYPMVDAFEARMGYAIDRKKLEAAARVLACPLKAHSPNWQHGRVLYAASRHYFRTVADNASVMLLDIGTAKGFSALVLKWAAKDSGLVSHVVSVDVVNPEERVFRNSIAETNGPMTVREFLAPWPESEAIDFVHSAGAEWLRNYSGRIHVAFVDGKHSYHAVKREGELLTMCQQLGDLAIFDDVQVPAVWAAVTELTAYTVEYLEVLPHRKYAIARRK